MKQKKRVKALKYINTHLKDAEMLLGIFDHIDPKECSLHEASQSDLINPFDDQDSLIQTMSAACADGMFDQYKKAFLISFYLTAMIITEAISLEEGKMLLNADFHDVNYKTIDALYEDYKEMLMIKMNGRKLTAFDFGATLQHVIFSFINVKREEIKAHDYPATLEVSSSAACMVAAARKFLSMIGSDIKIEHASDQVNVA